MSIVYLFRYPGLTVIFYMENDFMWLSYKVNIWVPTVPLFSSTFFFIRIKQASCKDL